MTRHFIIEDTSWLRYRASLSSSIYQRDREIRHGGSPRAIALGIGDSESNGRKVMSFHKYAITACPEPRSLAMYRLLVTGIRTLPPYSSSKTINEVLGVNTRPFRHTARSRYGIVP